MGVQQDLVRRLQLGTAREETQVQREATLLRQLYYVTVPQRPCHWVYRRCLPPLMAQTCRQ